jgi:hypothetical protein
MSMPDKTKMAMLCDHCGFQIRHTTYELKVSEFGKVLKQLNFCSVECFYENRIEEHAIGKTETAVKKAVNTIIKYMCLSCRLRYQKAEE